MNPATPPPNPAPVWLAGWRERWASSLRFRLLALGLMPLLVAFPVVIAVLVFVGGDRTHALLTANLRSNLASSTNHLEQAKTEARVRLSQLVRSQRLVDAIKSGADRADVDTLLQTAAENSGLDYLVAATANGQVIAASRPVATGTQLPDTYVVRQARIGVANSAYERLDWQQMAALAPDLQGQPGADGPAAVLLINAAAHFPLAVTMPDAILVGGLVLNQNTSLIGHMREVIYPVGTLPEGQEGLNRIFLGELPVASSQAMVGPIAGALDAQAPAAVAEQVLQRGQPWLGVHAVGDARYRMGYAPLVDGDGQRVGMINAGFPDAPYQRMALVLLGTVSALLALTMLAISALFLRTGREIASRLRAVEDTMNRVHHGERSARVARSSPPDELDRLGQAFNSLLDTIEAQEARQRAAQQMVEQRTVELAAANAAKSEFLANMSHEIRTPMNAVLGLTQLVLDSELKPAQRAHLDKAYQAATALLGILNDVLDYSKIEAGHLQIESVPLHLPQVLAQSVGLFETRAAEKGLQLTWQIAAQVPHTLHGDPLRLGQVLINLVGNAVKFTDHGGVHVAVECLGCDSNDVQLRFSVQDSGIGLTPEQARGVFGAFQQADASTTRRYGGTGLGLSISKRLVELMGGHIGVDSAPGQGSTFWFTARLAHSQAPREQAATAMPEERPLSELARLTQPVRGAKVLLVDDNPTNLLVAREFLEKLGCEVVTAEHGQAAVDRVGQQALDLVLMDLHMNGMDGLAAARAIRALPQGETLPIVALSAAALPRDIEASTQAGMNGHLAKPVSAQALADCLLRWVAPRHAAPPPPGPHTDAPPATAPLRTIALDTLRADLAQLDAWLASGSSRAFALSEQLTDRLHGSTLQPLYAHVQQAIDRFDFKSARQHLLALQQTTP